jgi:hypothetical protein
MLAMISVVVSLKGEPRLEYFLCQKHISLGLLNKKVPMEEKEISMEIINPHAALIDVGSRSHWVAVGQKEEDVREYWKFQ